MKSKKDVKATLWLKSQHTMGMQCPEVNAHQKQNYNTKMGDIALAMTIFYIQSKTNKLLLKYFYSGLCSSVYSPQLVQNVIWWENTEFSLTYTEKLAAVGRFHWHSDSADRQCNPKCLNNRVQSLQQCLSLSSPVFTKLPVFPPLALHFFCLLFLQMCRDATFPK